MTTQTRYKLSFTIDAETLFTILTRLLPIEDLSVTILNSVSPVVIPRRTKPPMKSQKPGRRKLNLTQGINRIIMDTLSSGMGRHVKKIAEDIKAGGYSYNSAGSRLQALQTQGIVEPLGHGVWTLVEGKQSLPSTKEQGAPSTKEEHANV